MNATLTNNSIAVNAQNITAKPQRQLIKKQNDSKEFLSGVFYIIKKVFLLG